LPESYFGRTLFADEEAVESIATAEHVSRMLETVGTAEPLKRLQMLTQRRLCWAETWQKELAELTRVPK